MNGTVGILTLCGMILLCLWTGSEETSVLARRLVTLHNEKRNDNVVEPKTKFRVRSYATQCCSAFLVHRTGICIDCRHAGTAPAYTTSM